MRSKTKRDLKQQQKGPNVNFIDPVFLPQKSYLCSNLNKGSTPFPSVVRHKLGAGRGFLFISIPTNQPTMYKSVI